MKDKCVWVLTDDTINEWTIACDPVFKINVAPAHLGNIGFCPLCDREIEVKEKGDES